MLVSKNAGLRTRRSTPPKLKSVGKDVSVSSLTDAIAGGPTEAFQQKLGALSHGTAAQGTGHTTERKNRTSLVSQWSLSTQTTLLGCFFCALRISPAYIQHHYLPVPAHSYVGAPYSAQQRGLKKAAALDQRCAELTCDGTKDKAHNTGEATLRTSL